MTAERAGGCELAQLVSDHLFRNVHRNMLFAVMYRDRVADEIGKIVEARDHVLTTVFLPLSFMD